MKITQINYLLITVTLCVAFLVWGTIFIERTVTDKNYHALTSQQQKVDAFLQCSRNAYSNANAQCAELVK